MSDGAKPVQPRRPLPPLTPRRRQFLWVAIAVWTLVAIERAITAATGHDVVFSAVMALLGFALAAGNVWELRRRSDPARTAGWGRGNHP